MAQQRTARPPQRKSAAPRNRAAASQRRLAQPQPARSVQRRSAGIWTSGGIDIPFLAIVVTLVVVGLIMMFSASYTYCYYYMGDSFFYLKRQLVFVLLGAFVMVAVSYVDYHLWKRFAGALLLVSYALLVIVLIMPPPAGFEDFHRWINLGPLTFQPSEVAKFTLILFLATHISKNYTAINTRGAPSNSPFLQHYNATHTEPIPQSKSSFALCGFVALSMCALVYKENHVSGAIILFALAVLMAWLAGFDKKYFFALLIFVAILVFAVITKPEILPAHAQSRIVSWLDKGYDPLGVRWQTNHATYAIGSGGLFGVGLGNSKMKQLYVSEPQNDFIFSICCEELGIVGALGIMALFILLLWRGFVIGTRAKDRFGSLLAMGLTFQVGLQTALNIAVVTDVFPNTGISLPFFSYGGTSFLMLIFEMGIVLSISRSAHIKKV